jgi:plasmid stabilization system protein ParE
MGWSAGANHPELVGLRVFPVSGFDRMLILYRPLAARVEILRVIHGSRDLVAFLRRTGIE